MSHDIESDYISESTNEERQCQVCNSYLIKNGRPFCKEAEVEVSEIGYCDFFKSLD